MAEHNRTWRSTVSVDIDPKGRDSCYWQTIINSCIRPDPIPFPSLDPASKVLVRPSIWQFTCYIGLHVELIGNTRVTNSHGPNAADLKRENEKHFMINAIV